MGLLTPDEVVKKALAFARENDVPMASLEGFVRQIIGWREFIKRIDEEYGETGRDQANHWNHDRRLNPCWWDATTGLPPVDAAIARCNRYGWCHHIERLMVLGATQLMAGIAPNESYRWFMEMFVDSAEWVMAPNVFGMSQMSDGGVFATKPYLSGSAYILKMSNYPAGPWTEIWDGLYWRFIHLHRDELEKNPRMKTVTYGLDRLNSDRKDRIFSLAENWINTVSSAATKG
jgi:deoxyribodipyrimidine photolyase-related protein